MQECLRERVVVNCLSTDLLQNDVEKLKYLIYPERWEKLIGRILWLNKRGGVRRRDQYNVCVLKECENSL